MPKPRSAKNKGLPARWRHTRNAYYYQVPPGMESAWDGKQTFKLGDTLPAAYKVWAARIDKPEQSHTTIGNLLDRYLLEEVPAKAVSTIPVQILWVKQLCKVFGAMSLTTIRPQHIYKYVDARSVKKKDPVTGRITGGKIAAHREIEVLSHAFTKAVEWGYIDRHPFKGEVRLKGEKPRDRYVEDWEVIECLALTGPRKKGGIQIIQAYIRLKLMTGMARSDLLRLTVTNDKPDGLHIQRHKTETTTGKRTVYQWTPELRAAVDLVKSLRPVLSPFLFCNRDGKCYIDEETGRSDGWDSNWQRFMTRVMAETNVTVKFTEHDLRAKCASDADSLEHARALLSHADARTTDKIYRRKPEIVNPLGVMK